MKTELLKMLTDRAVTTLLGESPGGLTAGAVARTYDMTTDGARESLRRLCERGEVESYRDGCSRLYRTKETRKGEAR